MFPERLVFIDLETAGLEPWRPVIQVAAVAVDRRLRELECFEAKIRFSHRRAEPKSLRKPKYDPRRWEQEGVSSRVAAQQFADFLKRHATVGMNAPDRRKYRVAQLVAHNATHDGAFIRHWFDKLGMFLPGHYRMLCTVQRAIWLFQEEPQRKPPKDFKLLTLCRYFDVRLTEAEAHDALNDVRATVELYKAMTRQGKQPSATVGTKSRRLPVEKPQPRNGWGRAYRPHRQVVEGRLLRPSLSNR